MDVSVCKLVEFCTSIRLFLVIPCCDLNGICVGVKVNDKLLALAAFRQKLIAKTVYQSHVMKISVVKFQQEQ